MLQQLNHLVNVSTLEEPYESSAVLTALAGEITIIHNTTN